MGVHAGQEVLNLKVWFSTNASMLLGALERNESGDFDEVLEGELLVAQLFLGQTLTPEHIGGARSDQRLVTIISSITIFVLCQELVDLMIGKTGNGLSVWTLYRCSFL